jgi:hypothetical protein
MNPLDPPDGLAIRMWLPNTGALFSIAANGATGISTPHRHGGQGPALVSVVFAAASLEAFLSESVYLAEFSNHLSRMTTDASREGLATADTFAQVLDDAEDSKASLESKFHLANLVLTGRAYEKGSPPYQDFRLLTDVRNALVHFKSKEYFSKMDGVPATFNQERVVAKLASKNLLHQPSPGSEGNFHLPAGETALASVEFLRQGRIVGSENPRVNLGPEILRTRWTYSVSTRAVAEWACSTAASMATDLIGKMPAGRWKDSVIQHLQSAFSIPWKS